MLSDTPVCASDRLRTSGWRAPVVLLLKRVIPHRWVRRIVGVDPPYGPPFLRVLAAVASREWLGWVPTFGLPSILALPGTITFRPDRSSATATSSASMLESMLPGTQELSGVYTYACKDARHNDYFYIFRYQAFWMRPASFALLQSLFSLVLKMLLMHAYASLFMLLSQSAYREAFAAELHRRIDRLRRWVHPRPPVRLIPITSDDICAFCHEELAKPPPDGEDEPGSSIASTVMQWALARWLCTLTRWISRGRAGERLREESVPQGNLGASALESRPGESVHGEGSASLAATGQSEDTACDTNEHTATESVLVTEAMERYILYCRWGCGKAVHRACAASWGRDSCVYCTAPMS